MMVVGWVVEGRKSIHLLGMFAIIMELEFHEDFHFIAIFVYRCSDVLLKKATWLKCSLCLRVIEEWFMDHNC